MIAHVLGCMVLHMSIKQGSIERWSTVFDQCVGVGL